MVFETEVGRLFRRVRSNDPTLTILDLSMRDLCPRGISRLSEALLHNTHVVVLFLTGNRMENAGAQVLAASCPKSVQYLYVGRNGIGPEGALALSQFTQLKILDLRRNQLGCDGAISLAKLLLDKKDSCLHSLVLRENNIQDKGMLRLAESLRTNKSLQSLDLRGNNCSASAYQQLKDACRVNTTLQRISLDVYDIQEVLNLYRIGRAFRRGLEILPKAWPEMFCRFAKEPDLLNFVLRGRPEIILEAA